jgi:hypothetical protein
MNLVFGDDKTIADWVSKQRGKSIPPWYFAVGVINKSGVLKGAATFHNYNGSNIELCYHGPNTLTLNVFKGIADFCINRLKVNRLTVSVPRKNKSLIKHLPKFGFKVEGVMRHFYGPFRRDDAIIFGILSSEGKIFL